MVCSEALVIFSRSEEPYPLARTILPSLMTATDAPASVRPARLDLLPQRGFTNMMSLLR
jgi:hypothetical protein